MTGKNTNGVICGSPIAPALPAGADGDASGSPVIESLYFGPQ